MHEQFWDTEYTEKFISLLCVPLAGLQICSMWCWVSNKVSIFTILLKKIYLSNWMWTTFFIYVESEHGFIILKHTLLFVFWIFCKFRISPGSTSVSVQKMIWHIFRFCCNYSLLLWEMIWVKSWQLSLVHIIFDHIFI